MNPAVRTHVFRRSSENLNNVHLGVDAGMLSVAVMPRAALAAKGEEYVRSCCVVLPFYPGESVGVERGEQDSLATIDVSHGGDLAVPETAGEEWVLVMGDPCYYLNGEYGTDADYGRACSASVSDDGWGFIDLAGGGRALVSRTVYGDGTYPVRVRPGGFTLLLENEKDEEDDWCWWDDEDEDEDGWGDDDSDDEDELLDGEDEE